MLRGGSWFGSIDGSRSAHRYYANRYYRPGNIGFRVARNINDQPLVMNPPDTFSFGEPNMNQLVSNGHGSVSLTLIMAPSAVAYSRVTDRRASVPARALTGFLLPVNRTAAEPIRCSLSMGVGSCS